VPGAKFSDADREKLTARIQFGGDEVVATVPAQTPPSGESKVAEPVAAGPKSPAPEKLLPKAWDPKVLLGPDASIQG
jgi:hypothetical protein